jgi:glycosyltransferase involved in cell wall biosynthesis
VINKTEKEIMEHWRDTQSTPLVSVSCNTYNHEKYISKAIDSFLMQETDFPFEILIHDDASTDKTAEIIRAYEKKYPSLIKPIYQTENQYTTVKVISVYNFSRARGEYIALCEGDDYWTDNKKLQYQIEKMKQQNDCEISFHPAVIVNDQTITEEVAARHLDHDSVYDVRDIIKGDGGFCPTGSLIIKKSAVDNLPAFFTDAPVEDYFLQVLGAVNAGALYIDRLMSAYRVHPNGVWTSKLNNFELLSKSVTAMSKALEDMDQFYDFRYHDAITSMISNMFLGILSNPTFHIYDRIELYNRCKIHLSSEQQIEQQQRFIEDQKQLLSDKENECRQLQSEITQRDNDLKTLSNAVKKITQFPVLQHPINKYKAYKSMLLKFSKNN